MTKEITDECGAEVEIYYEGMRSEDLDKLLSADETTYSRAESLATTCDLGSWAWTPSEYTMAVEQIQVDQDIDFSGFIGLSFGPNRFSYLDSTEQFDWAWLIHPAPPTGPADSFLAVRSDGLLNVFQNYCGEDCSSAEELDDQFGASLDAFDGESVAISGRSVDATSFDLLFSLYGLSNTDPKWWSSLPDMLAEPDTQAESLGSLSDSVWTRTGTTNLSPAHLGYLAEVCSHYQDWDSIRNIESATAKSFWILHLPCRNVPSEQKQLSGKGPESNIKTFVCIAGSGSDPVSSISNAIELDRKYKNSILLTNATLGHSGTQAIADCGENYEEGG